MDLLRPITPDRPLDSLVLPVATRQALRGFVEEARTGTVAAKTTALFLSGALAGAAAEAVAHELGRGLVRVDFSAVVSERVGKTEKKAGRAFAAAEQSGAVLFFDEADALFGRRNEVKDSHDRYADIEINYLLERMESFGGVAIVATKVPVHLALCRFCRYIELPGP